MGFSRQEYWSGLPLPSPMFSTRSFIFSGLSFRSLIHFEFIFVYGVRKCSSFILSQMVDQFSQHHLLKRLSSPLYIEVHKRRRRFHQVLEVEVGKFDTYMWNF